MAKPGVGAGEVLYGDYNGHLQPLSFMYFSLDSRCLVADHPESVQHEVESHFCPNCNSLCTTLEAHVNDNRCLHCFECPCCGSVLAPAPTSLEPSSSPQAARPQCCLQCLYCQWTSEEIGIVGSEPSRLPEAAIAREKKDARDRTVVFDLLKSTKLRESKTLRIAGGRFAGGGITWEDSSASPDVAPSDDSWKVADIDEAVSRRKRAVEAAARSVDPTSSVTATSVVAEARETTNPVPWRLQRDADGPDSALWSLSSGHDSAGLKYILEGGTVTSQGLEGAGWPRRVRLRTRLGKRCRKDLSTGRSGILIKATFNPLEGDSSGAKGGKWFKKDCSAALFVPRITIVYLPLRASMESLHESGEDSSAGTSKPPAKRPGVQPSIVLRLGNPQDTLMRIRFAEDVPSGKVDTGADPATDLTKIDSFEGEEPRKGVGRVRGDGKKNPSVEVVVRTKGWGDDDWVRLEGKEDEFLRPPGDRHRLPESVAKMRNVDSDSGRCSSEDVMNNSTPPFLLHQQGDVAWVRLPLDGVLTDGETTTPFAAAAPADVFLSTRFLLVMREGEEGNDAVGASGSDVEVPIVVRFPLSSCP